MNFCRLPPDRLCALARTPLALTLKVSMMPRAKAAARLRSTRPRRTDPRRWPVSTPFSVSECDGTAPRPSRSSGTKAIPRSRRRSGWSVAGSGAARCGSPRASRCSVSPLSKATSSAWPLPETPAMPTISPPNTSKEMSPRSTPYLSAAAADKPLTSSTGRSLRHGRAHMHLRKPRADHHARQLDRACLPGPGRAGHTAVAQHGRACRRAAAPRPACG